MQDPNPGIIILLCELFTSIAEDLAPDATRYFPRIAAMVLPIMNHPLHTVQEAVLNFIEVSSRSRRSHELQCPDHEAEVCQARRMGSLLFVYVCVCVCVYVCVCSWHRINRLRLSSLTMPSWSQPCSLKS